MPSPVRLRAQIRVFEVGVAGVDDEIALFEVPQQIVDHRIHRRAGGHQHHHCTRLSEQSDEFLDVCHAVDVVFRRFLLQRFDLAGVLVIARHWEAVIRQVQHEISPHDAQADHTDCILLLCLLIGHSLAFRAVCG